MTQVCAVYGVRATVLLHMCHLCLLHEVSCVVLPHVHFSSPRANFPPLPDLRCVREEPHISS